jgi:monovalent cation:H+ antiporter-2, CPA2 family
MHQLLLKDILLIFICAIPVVLFFNRLHLPTMIGFLITGALMGTQGFGLIEDPTRIDLLAELGLALLLFSVGLEFSFDNFKQIKNRALTLAFLQIILTFGAGWLIGHLLNWPLSRCLYFGCVLALSSSAVVMHAFHVRKTLDSIPGQLVTAILIVQDLAFIPMLILLPLVHAPTDTTQVWSAMLSEKTIALLSLVMVFVVGRLILGPFLRLVSSVNRREVFAITVITIGFGLSWVTAEMGLTFALGSFVAGILIGSTEYKYQALAEVTPFRYCFNSLFFVAIGMLLNFQFIADNLLFTCLLVIFIPIIKMSLVTLVSLFLRLPFKIAIITGLAIAQIGEFSFLIIHSGYQAGVIDGYLHDLIIASSIFAMMLTPIIINNSSRIADFVSRLLPVKTSTSSTTNERNRSLKDHVIICGFGPLGKTLGALLDKHDIPYLVLELNPKTIKLLRSKDVLAFYGDGSSEEILEKSCVDTAKIMAITVPDFLENIAITKQVKQLNPDIKVITRAKYRNDVEKLYAAGSDVVISEELEGGIEMSRYALQLVGLPGDEVNALMKSIRDYGSADFFN